MKKTTFIFSFLSVLILGGCGNNSSSSNEKKVEELEIQKAEEAQEKSEAARKSAEVVRKRN